MSAWNDERVEQLKQLVAEGHSYSAIARMLGGGISREAAIGKASRLGLCQPRTFKNKPRNPPGRKLYLPPDKLAIAKARAQMRAEPDIVVPAGERRGVLDLARDDCRWPLGDPRAPDFTFCNRKQVAGLPYCDFHVRRAYETPTVRAAARREAAQARELEAA